MNRPPPSDEIVRCVVTGSPVRIVATTTTGVAAEAVRRHEGGEAAAIALGRALTSGLLLATLTKDEERVTLQILGDGPLGGITVDASAAGTTRGYLKHPFGGLAPAASGGRRSLAGAVGRQGVVSVIRDLGLRENFSGQVSIASGEIDEDVERYLGDSEQVVSALACDTLIGPGGEILLAAGLLVQALPGSEGIEVVGTARELIKNGAFTRTLADLPPSAEALIDAALGESLGPIKVLERRPVSFFCPCSRERARATLELLGEAELAAMIVEDGRAEVSCNFCRARYELDANELEELRRKTRGPSPPPS